MAKYKIKHENTFGLFLKSILNVWSCKFGVIIYLGVDCKYIRPMVAELAQSDIYFFSYRQKNVFFSIF